MGLFGQAKDLYQLQKKAKQVKKQLRDLHIEAEVEGVIITINGEQEVISLKIPDALLGEENRERLQNKIVEAFNKAIKKSQEIAAEKMKDVMGDMGLDLPGLTSSDK